MALAAVDWGSVPDWFAGAGALLALLLAFVAVRAAHRTNMRQSNQLDRQSASSSRPAASSLRARRSSSWNPEL